MYLAMASDTAVSEIVGHKMVTYRAVGSEVVLSEVAAYRTVISEMVACEIAVLEMTIYKVQVVVSGESCLDTACYESKLKELSNETTLVLSNTRKLDRVLSTK